ncbi:hypothetical protein GCM10025770_24900 [Viridibacterium curvum]|uniref:Uncharacterized protein n=1 Tax=Viridibacterium curvum TaxID=1101404 RepID=A0ABP9QTX5_9RHOO
MHHVCLQQSLCANLPQSLESASGFVLQKEIYGIGISLASPKVPFAGFCLRLRVFDNSGYGVLHGAQSARTNAAVRCSATKQAQDSIDHVVLAQQSDGVEAPDRSPQR